MKRYEANAARIHREREEIAQKYLSGKLTLKAHDARLAELKQTEHQNVIGRGVIFRRYEDQLASNSGGKVDIQSVLEFMPDRGGAARIKRERPPRFAGAAFLIEAQAVVGRLSASCDRRHGFRRSRRDCRRRSRRNVPADEPR